MPLEPVMQALLFSAHEHRKTRRKDQITPYINHPLAVVYKLVEHGVRDFVVLCGAALHDVVEDEHTDPVEIEARFGAEVTQIVLEVTDNKLLPKSERKRLHVETARALSDGAKLLKMADKICNMTDLAHNPPTGWSTKLIRGYAEWCDQCMSGYRTGQYPTLEKEFDDTVSNLLAHISNIESQQQDDIISHKGGEHA